MATAGRDWHLLAGGAGDGAHNMALDQTLLEAVQGGAPALLRLYRWEAPTLSFGRNQPAAGLYDETGARARGIAFVRRPTGGQAVLHADELTYAVVAPVDVIGRPRDAYRRINEALVAGLRGLGVDAEVAGSGTGTTRARGAHTHSGAIDWGAACFRDPAEGEVVVGGRKLVGSAQRCERRVILQHGSILLSGSQAAAEELLLRAPRRAAAGVAAGVASAEAAPGWTTLEAELGRRPSPVSLADALAEGFREVLGTRLARGDLSIEETRRAEELRDTFASPGWTWRR